MSFVSDIANDALQFDATQTVTLRQLRSDGATSVTVENVTSSPVSQRMAISMGVLELDGSERSMSLPVNEVGNDGVRRGDLITLTDTSVWEIVGCDIRTVGTRWLCVCREQL